MHIKTVIKDSVIAFDEAVASFWMVKETVWRDDWLQKSMDWRHWGLGFRSQP